MSENYKRNYVWYRLAGKSEQALRRVMEIDRSGEQAPKQELRDLGEKLGYFFPVAQQGPDCTYAVFPAVFGYPSSLKDEFFLKAPIGYRKDATGETHFQPEDGETLTEKEADHLEMGLFPPQGGSIPIIERYPIPLTPAAPSAPPPSGPKP
ncbi:MAG: hypothetical protein H5T99_01780 [Moorella sp. (in: Bacteria)]|nr:hypothetical protein [Moorella sp. (in: firmicutes)]